MTTRLVKTLVLLLLASISLTIFAQGDATPQPTEEMDMGDDSEGMDMETGYSVDDLAPLAMAYYEGETVYFIHPEASNPDVAQVLTEMMGPDVLTVPSLAEIPAELLGNVYVFTNGVEAMGPLGYQPDVFDTVPGDEAYTPLRAISLVTWAEDSEPRELTSVDEILDAETAGELTIEQPGVVVNMPILVWGEATR
jgi:hypothetical protein